jgi:hypothetical protein
MTTAHTAGHRQLCYETSRWERALFDRRSPTAIVATATKAVSDALSTTGPGKAEAREAQMARKAVVSVAENARDFGAEVFARLYADPARLDTPQGPAWVAKAHEILGALPEMEGLRASAEGDPDMAALAAAELLHGIAGKIPELIREAEANPATPPGPGEEPGEGKPGPGTSPSGANRTSADAAAVRAALRRGIARATQRVGDAREALEGLAPGMGSPPPTHQQADEGRLKLAERLLREPRMRDVLKRAGRITRLARDKRTTRDEHSRQEVVDIERGADLARILPAGLVRLRHPLLRKLALREIVERQAIQYRLEGRETLGRGPIVVLLDRSSSMRGDPELWASAVAIAMLGAGARERRPVTVVEFTASVDTVSRLVRGVGERLSPEDPADVRATGIALATLAVELASRHSDGGTSFGPVLRYGLACGALDDRADLVIVTDGLATADEDALAQLADAKKRGLRLYALTVNGGSLSPTIEAIADVAVDLDKAEDVGAAIAAAVPA